MRGCRALLRVAEVARLAADPPAVGPQAPDAVAAVQSVTKVVPPSWLQLANLPTVDGLKAFSQRVVLGPSSWTVLWP